MHKSVLVLLFLAVPALGVEPLPSATLLEQCASQDESAHLACRSWVHGFLGGAFASRTAKLTDAQKKETFSERATRTRITRARPVYGQNYDAAYCIAKETTIDELVEKLQVHAADVKEMPEHANQLLLGMLRKHYPCTKKQADR